jgi:hypothetical protein
MTRAPDDPVYLNMNARSTRELLDLWRENDRAEWSDSAFAAIEAILRARGETPPLQRQSVQVRKAPRIITPAMTRPILIGLESVVWGIVPLAWAIATALGLWPWQPNAGPPQIFVYLSVLAGVVVGRKLRRDYRRYFNGEGLLTPNNPALIWIIVGLFVIATGVGMIATASPDSLPNWIGEAFFIPFILWRGSVWLRRPEWRWLGLMYAALAMALTGVRVLSVLVAFPRSDMLLTGRNPVLTVALLGAGAIAIGASEHALYLRQHASEQMPR